MRMRNWRVFKNCSLGWHLENFEEDKPELTTGEGVEEDKPELTTGEGVDYPGTRGGGD